MQTVVDFMITAGPAGMFLAAFLSGSVLPFSSELVMLGLLATGADPVGLLVWGTAGNVLGSGLNYFIGSLGKEEWIEKYVKLTPEKLERGKKYVRRYGAWAGFLAWLPVLGEIITVAMGYMRTNLWTSTLAVTAGKYIRYQIIVSTWLAAQT